MTLEEFDAFKDQLKQLCSILGRRFDDSLCQAYWTVLRSMPLSRFQAKCKGLMENADGDTRFPRPAFFLPKEPRPATAQEVMDGFIGDRWDIAGNHLLLAYLRRQLANEPRKWGVSGSPQQARATCILVKHRKSWSELMRNWGVTAEGELEIPPAADQNAAWKGAMESAEHEIAHPELDAQSQLLVNWYGRQPAQAHR